MVASANLRSVLSNYIWSAVWRDFWCTQVSNEILCHVSRIFSLGYWQLNKCSYFLHALWRDTEANKKRIPLNFYGQYETEPYLFSTRSSSVENGGYAIALCRNDSNIISYSSKSLEFKEAQEFCRSRAVNDYKLGHGCWRQFVGDKCAILVIDSLKKSPNS